MFSLFCQDKMEKRSLKSLTIFLFFYSTLFITLYFFNILIQYTYLYSTYIINLLVNT
jgi:hypothetical protein